MPESTTAGQMGAQLIATNIEHTILNSLEQAQSTPLSEGVRTWVKGVSLEILIQLGEMGVSFQIEKSEELGDG